MPGSPEFRVVGNADQAHIHAILRDRIRLRQARGVLERRNVAAFRHFNKHSRVIAHGGRVLIILKQFQSKAARVIPHDRIQTGLE